MINTQRIAMFAWVTALLLGLAGSWAGAQGLGEMSAAQSGMDALNSGPVGPGAGVGMNALNRARGVTGRSNLNVGRPGQTGRGGAAAAVPVVPEIQLITVITGTRVFDAFPHNQGQLLDDAVKKKVPITEKDKYNDNGNQEYTSVKEQRDVLGPANQKAKEQLVEALIMAEGLDPVEFYGDSIMSTDRHESAPRNRAWEIVPDPHGGPGFTLAERPIAKPLTVPKYRDKQKEKDLKFKDENGNGWAYKFLEGYRKNSDSLTSEFYPLYIPQPPQPPTVLPPGGWVPFGDPNAIGKFMSQLGLQNKSRGGSRGGGGSGGGMGGMGGGGRGSGGGGGGMGGGGRR